MKKSWLLIALLLLIALPLAGSAEIIRVKVDVPTVEAGVAVAQSGDTLVLPVEMSYMMVDTGDKDLVVGVDALPPDDAPIDSTVYGPNHPFPSSPLE